MNSAVVLCILFSVIAVLDVGAAPSQDHYHHHEKKHKKKKHDDISAAQIILEGHGQGHPPSKPMKPMKPPPPCSSDPMYEMVRAPNGQEHWYKFVNDSVMWQEAYNYCKMDGAHLPVMHNKYDDMALSYYMHQHYIRSNIWLGITQVGNYKYHQVDGTFFHIDPVTGDSPDGYQNFLDSGDKDIVVPGDPEGYDDENCISKESRDETYAWEDEDCDTMLLPFVCECDHPDHDEHDDDHYDHHMG